MIITFYSNFSTDLKSNDTRKIEIEPTIRAFSTLSSILTKDAAVRKQKYKFIPRFLMYGHIQINRQ